MGNEIWLLYLMMLAKKEGELLSLKNNKIWNGLPSFDFDLIGATDLAREIIKKYGGKR
jgi:hypothetical protein